MQQIASDLGLDTSKAPALKPYVVTGDFSGNLSRTSGLKADTVNRYTHINGKCFRQHADGGKL